MSKPTGNPNGRPATGLSPIRQIRIADELWQVIVEAAKLSSQTPSAFVRQSAVIAAQRALGRRKKGSDREP